MSTQVTANPFVSPTQIPGCALWLDGADRNSLVLSGSNVTQWSDKSGGGRNFIQQGSFALPVFVNNGISSQSAVSFTGNSTQNDVANQILTNATFSLNSSAAGYSIFAITLQNTTRPSFTQYNYIISAYGGGAGSGLFYGTDPNGFLLTANGTAGPSFGFNDLTANVPNTTMTTTRLTEIVVNGSVLTPYLNGTAMAAKVGTCVALTGISIGNAYAPGQTFTGQTWGGLIGEILIYNSVVSTPQRQQLEGYLAWKWGLQANLPASHPYKNSPIPPLLNPPRTLPVVRQNPSVTVWFPSQISGLNLWLDAQDPNANGIPPANLANLTAWSDKSPSRFRLTSSGSAYSTTAVNQLPGINISTNFFGFDPGSPQNNWQEVFAVGLWTGGSTFNTFNGFVTSSVDSDGGSGGGIILIGNSGTTVWHPSSYDVPWLNGTQTNTFLPTGAQPFVIRRNSSSSVNLRGIRFGVDRSNGRPWVGFISEVLCYNTALTLSQRQQIEGYLAWKWALVSLLPSTHPYKTIVPSLAPVPVSGVSRASINVWSPLQISGCTLWLDPTDLTTFTFSGLNITQWRDKSTTAAVFTGVNNPVLSSTRYSGNRPISFGGTAYFQNTTFTYTTSNRSAFFVFDETTEQTHVGVLSFASSGTDWNQLNTMVYETGSKPTQYLQIAQSHTNGGYAMTIQSSTIGFALYSDTFGSGRETAYVNGSQTGTTTSAAAFTNSTGLVIGARMASGSVSNQLIGVIGEIILYNRPLSTSERQQVEGYLAWKWGLVSSLPSNHPYKKWPPSP
jgi:hypothetical protein